MNLKALHKISYGIFVVSSKYQDKTNAQIANTVFQVASEPVLTAVSISKKNFTHEFISKSKIFCASIVSEEADMGFIGKFGFKSGRDSDKFQGSDKILGVTKTPIIKAFAVSYMEVEVINNIDAGSHTVFLGKVVGAEILNDKKPMTYDYYHMIKGGKLPKNAPHYIIEDKAMAQKGGEKYQCTVCGYIYNPENGDPDGNIKPGTPFGELPGTWVCPVCGAKKEMFKPI